MFVFIDGRFVPEKRAVVSVFDRGFLYGDALFETIRIVNGTPFRWEQHWDRLERGAGFLKVRMPFSSRELRGVLNRLVIKNKMPDSLLRLTLSRGPGGAGYSPKNAESPSLVMSMRPAPRIGRKVPRWSLITSSFRVAAGDRLAGFKTCSKLPQVLARGEADAAGADEALLVNTDGHVTEGTAGNLFWVEDGILCTPPLGAGILPGITRGVVFEIASQLGVQVRQKNVSLKELARAAGLFLSLTSWGIVEARSLDSRRLKLSPLTPVIALAYNRILLNSCACNQGANP